MPNSPFRSRVHPAPAPASLDPGSPGVKTSRSLLRSRSLFTESLSQAELDARKEVRRFTHLPECQVAAKQCPEWSSMNWRARFEHLKKTVELVNKAALEAKNQKILGKASGLKWLKLATGNADPAWTLGLKWVSDNALAAALSLQTEGQRPDLGLLSDLSAQNLNPESLSKLQAKLQSKTESAAQKRVRDEAFEEDIRGGGEDQAAMADEPTLEELMAELDAGLDSGAAPDVGSGDPEADTSEFEAAQSAEASAAYDNFFFQAAVAQPWVAEVPLADGTFSVTVAPADIKFFVVTTVTLPYTKAEFDQAKQDKYKAAMAATAGTSAANVDLETTEKHRRVNVKTKIRASDAAGADKLTSTLGTGDNLKTKLNAELAKQSLKACDSSGVTTPVKTAVELKDHVVDFTKEEWDSFGITNLRSTDYIKVGGSCFKPIESKILDNPKLAGALLQKTEFTQQEWDAFHVDDLRMHHFVKSGDSYFQPAAAAPELHHDADAIKAQQRQEKKKQKKKEAKPKTSNQSFSTWYKQLRPGVTLAEKKTPITKCVYLNQGDFKYFCDYVEKSKVLGWDDENTKNRLKFKDQHTMLVFGGNSQDNRGPPSTINETNTARLSELFGNLDRNGDGKLSLEEVTTLAKVFSVPDEQVHEFFKQIDKDNSGGISETEFLDFFKKGLECDDLDVLSPGDDAQERLEELLQATIIGSDIRFTKLLLDLKAQKGNEDRVVLIMGYRDINKLRLASELQDECISDPAVLNDECYPYLEEEGLSPQKYLHENIKQRQIIEQQGNNVANRLRYILDKTMDAAGSFERRKMELRIMKAALGQRNLETKAPGLKWLPAGDTEPTGRNLEHKKLAEALTRKKEFTKQEWEAFGIKDLHTYHFIKSGDSYFQPAVKDITDDDVVESFRNEVNPTKDQVKNKYGADKYVPTADTEKDNFVLQYLRQGKLAHIFGKTLFLHRTIAMDPTKMGKVPVTKRNFDKIDEWVQALNEWGAGQVEQFEQDPYSGKDKESRKGSGLVDYAKPGGIDDINKRIVEGDNVLSRVRVGLKWQPVGDTKPTEGRLLDNRQLTDALASKPSKPAPKCPTAQHVMVISTGTYNAFGCDRCGALKSGERWFCGNCRNDFCFKCEPLRMVDFTKEDLDKFGITDLHSTDFIKAGDSYFKPIENKKGVVVQDYFTQNPEDPEPYKVEWENGEVSGWLKPDEIVRDEGEPWIQECIENGQISQVVAFQEGMVYKYRGSTWESFQTLLEDLDSEEILQEEKKNESGQKELEGDVRSLPPAKQTREYFRKAYAYHFPEKVFSDFQPSYLKMAQVQIYIEPKKGKAKPITLQVELSENINTVKSKIKDKKQTPVEQQSLFLKTWRFWRPYKELRDCDSLDSYKIEEGSTIYIDTHERITLGDKVAMKSSCMNFWGENQTGKVIQARIDIEKKLFGMKWVDVGTQVPAFCRDITRSKKPAEKKLAALLNTKVNRDFCLTVSHCDPPAYKAETMNYLIFGNVTEEEEGDGENTRHYHCYVQYRKNVAVTFKSDILDRQIKVDFGSTACVEDYRGSDEDRVQYVKNRSREGTVSEEGTRISIDNRFIDLTYDESVMILKNAFGLKWIHVGSTKPEGQELKNELLAKVLGGKRTTKVWSTVTLKPEELKDYTIDGIPDRDSTLPEIREPRLTHFVKAHVDKEGFKRFRKGAYFKPAEEEWLSQNDCIKAANGRYYRPFGVRAGSFEFPQHKKEAPYIIVSDLPQQAQDAEGSSKPEASSEISPEIYNIHLIQQLLMEKWKLERPDIIITITGGATDFDMSSTTNNDVLMKGLMDTRALKPIFITGGSNSGIMEYVGKARAKYTPNVPLIGIGSAKAVLGEGSDLWKQTEWKKHAKSKIGLDHNHSHFILIEDQVSNSLGNHSVALRGEFEKCLGEAFASESDEAEHHYEKLRAEFRKLQGLKGSLDPGGVHVYPPVPVVSICVQGGPESITTVLKFVNAKIPSLVVKGSGKAADLLADVVISKYTHSNSEDNDEDTFLKPKDQAQAALKDVLQKLSTAADKSRGAKRRAPLDLSDIIQLLKNWESGEEAETDDQRSIDVKLRKLMCESYSIVQKGTGADTAKNRYKHLRESLEAVNKGLVLVFDVRNSSADFNQELLKCALKSIDSSSSADAWYKLKYAILARDDLVPEQLKTEMPKITDDQIRNDLLHKAMICALQRNKVHTLRALVEFGVDVTRFQVQKEFKKGFEAIMAWTQLIEYIEDSNQVFKFFFRPDQRNQDQDRRRSGAQKIQDVFLWPARQFLYLVDELAILLLYLFFLILFLLALLPILLLFFLLLFSLCCCSSLWEERDRDQEVDPDAGPALELFRGISPGLEPEEVSSMITHDTVTFPGDFLTVRSRTKCPLGAKAYYEIEILETEDSDDDVCPLDACPQYGFASAFFDSDGALDEGVGDDAHSWAVDGMRRRKWHVSGDADFTKTNTASLSEVICGAFDVLKRGDQNVDRELSLEEVMPLFKALGAPDEHVQQGFSDIDTDGSGLISKDEFRDFFRTFLGCDNLDDNLDDAEPKKVQQVLQTLRTFKDLAYDCTWKAGDVIGLACDLEEMQIHVSVNGKFAAPNGVVFKLAPDAVGNGLFAAFSGLKGKVRYNLGDFKYDPPAKDFFPLLYVQEYYDERVNEHYPEFRRMERRLVAEDDEKLRNQKKKPLEGVYRDLLGEKMRYRMGALGAHLDLFLLCVLMNQRELAFEFWKQCKVPVGDAICAAALFRAMAEQYFFEDPVACDIMKDNANFFEELAIGVQTAATEDDSQSRLALRALDINLLLFKQDTILDLVVAHDCLKFLSKHCSAAITIQLYGDMEANKMNTIEGMLRILLGIATLGLVPAFIPDFLRWDPPPKSEQMRRSRQRRVIPVGYPWAELEEMNAEEVNKRSLSGCFSWYERMYLFWTCPTVLFHTDKIICACINLIFTTWFVAHRQAVGSGEHSIPIPLPFKVSSNLDNCTAAATISNATISQTCTKPQAEPLQGVEICLCIYYGCSFLREVTEIMCALAVKWENKLDVLKNYISSFWNVLDLAEIMAFVVGILYRVTTSIPVQSQTRRSLTNSSAVTDAQEYTYKDEEWTNWSMAYGACLFIAWFRVLRSFTLSKKLGTLVGIFYTMLMDVSIFIIIYCVCLLSCTILFIGIASPEILQPKCTDGDLDSPECRPIYILLRTLFQSFGELYLDEISNTPSMVFLILTFILLNMVLLNLLIAMMASTYQGNLEKSEQKVLLDAYDIARRSAYILISAPCPFNIVAIILELFFFAIYYGKVNKKFKGCSFGRRLELFLRRNSQPWTWDTEELEDVRSSEDPTISACMEQAKIKALGQGYGKEDFNQDNVNAGLELRIQDLEEQIKANRKLTSRQTSKFKDLEDVVKEVADSLKLLADPKSGLTVIDDRMRDATRNEARAREF